MGAADTFRAAAADQLETWGARVNVPVVRSDKDGADPASVAFEASAKAKEANADVLIIDTAGRLQNKSNLMDELGKIRRVTEKNLPVDEVLLVLDATTGQNGMAQAKVFAEANASGHLTNAANYLAIVGPANDEEAKERAGFYAERMVLTATLRGLGTLWVAGSWDKAEAAKHCRVTSGQELYLGVVIGHPKNHLDYQAKSYEELCEAQRTHRATKTYEQFTATMSDEGREAAPDWFKSGVEAAMKAPSAMNRQPITFSYNPADDTAAAHIDQSAEDEHHAFNDMGIAKLHFQIGAGQGQWAWGDGGLFIHK